MGRQGIIAERNARHTLCLAQEKACGPSDAGNHGRQNPVVLVRVLLVLGLGRAEAQEARREREALARGTRQHVCLLQSAWVERKAPGGHGGADASRGDSGPR